MVQGIITTKHILTHPITLIVAVGLIGYLSMLKRCLDGRPHCFIDLIFELQSKKRK